MYSMKHIIFVIHKLGAGGAEKSLVALLNSLPLNEFNVDLIAIDPHGIFRDQVPNQVHIIKAPKELICQSSRITSKTFWRATNFRTLALKILCIICCKLRNKRSKLTKSHDQFYNDFWKNAIPNLQNYYDVAISYMDCVNYYVIDHINAGKKILWCHNDYNKLDLVSEYDRNYFALADNICTISERCRMSLLENFPQFADKIEVIENISSSKLINAQATNLEEMRLAGDGFVDDKRFRIVSIGRLAEQKGFDYAIDAARILSDGGLDFCWYILGEGSLRKELESRALRLNVADCIKFIGVRSNPYSYINKSDIFVMPSRYEGKSIALDEAKILCKPIVVTNYPSVCDAIVNEKNGLIVEISAQAIAAGIKRLYDNKSLRDTFVSELRLEDCSHEKTITDKFLGLL